MRMQKKKSISDSRAAPKKPFFYNKVSLQKKGVYLPKHRYTPIISLQKACYFFTGG